MVRGWVRSLMSEQGLFRQIRADLERHEGRKSKLYRCTAGKITVGVGWNIEDNGLPDFIIDMLLDYSIDVATSDLKMIFGEQLDAFPDHVKRALINMSFQLGYNRLSKFHNTINLIKQGDYKRAAAEVLDSKWAREDSPSRAKEVSSWLAGDI